jgi:hypothetical protein
VADDAHTTALERTSGPVSLVRDYDQAKSFAKAYALTSFGNRGDNAQRAAEALVKIEAGAELGMGPMAAIGAFHVIEGKPTLSGHGWAALIKGHPRYDYKVGHRDRLRCVLRWFEGGELVGESSFSMADAKAAQLDGKAIWKKYPEAMLFNRALTAGARIFCPDVAMGLPIYTPEELEVTQDDVPIAEPEPEPEPTDVAFEEQPAEEVAARRSALEDFKAAALEIDACATADDLAAWVEANEERVERMPDKAASRLYALHDGLTALRSGVPWKPVAFDDKHLFADARKVAGLPEVDPTAVVDDPPDDFEMPDDSEMPDDQRHGGGAS